MFSRQEAVEATVARQKEGTSKEKVKGGFSKIWFVEYLWTRKDKQELALGLRQKQ